MSASLTLLLLTAVVGCGGASTDQLTLDLTPTPLTTDQGAPVTYLGTWTSTAGSTLSFWGSVDADGVPTRLAQALYWEKDAQQGVRIQYDGQGLPIRLEQEATGAFVQVFWEDAQATFKFYQADGTYVGGDTVMSAAKNFTDAQVKDSKVVGYYSGTLDGLEDGIVTFTVGGTTAATPTGALRGQKGSGQGALTQQVTREGLTPAQQSRANQALTALAGSLTQPASSFAAQLIAAVGDGYAAGRGSSVSLHITQTALSGSALSPAFTQNSPYLLDGIGAAYRLGLAAKHAQAQGLDAGTQTAVSAGALSPSPVSYRNTTTYLTSRPATDSTGVQGIVASRELGAVSMAGYVTASGALYLEGTAQSGDVISLQGSVQTGLMGSGSWTLKSLASGGTGAGKPTSLGGDSSGSWNAQQTNLGQCSVQENSGGQGIFSNTYDLSKCGDFPFDYNAFTIPDQFQIFQDTDVIFDTGGEVSGSASETVSAVGQSTLVRVIVTANNEGTAWTYTVGCPQ